VFYIQSQFFQKYLLRKPYILYKLFLYPTYYITIHYLCLKNTPIMCFYWYIGRFRWHILSWTLYSHILHILKSHLHASHDKSSIGILKEKKNFYDQTGIRTPEYWNKSQTHYPLHHQYSFRLSRLVLSQINRHRHIKSTISTKSQHKKFLRGFSHNSELSLIANFFEISQIFIAFLKYQKLKSHFS
jgi:hypothetical protein